MSNNEITFKDTDLCEALRRIYANTPPPPADFMTGDGEDDFVIRNVSVN